jgi:Fe-S cluster biogenesis protein NfuA
MSVMKRNRRNRPDVESRIRATIGAMKSLLHSETYEIELVEFDGTNGDTVLRISGDCPECDMNASGFLQGIEAHLRLRVPEVGAVRAVCPDRESNAR